MEAVRSGWNKGHCAVNVPPRRDAGTSHSIQTSGASDLLVQAVVIDQRRAGAALVDRLDHAEINVMGGDSLDFDHAAIKRDHRAHQGGRTSRKGLPLAGVE